MTDAPDKSTVSQVLGWISTAGQASATTAGAFLLGGADAATDIFPYADVYASAGLGGVGGLSLMLAAQSFSAFRARRRQRRLDREAEATRREIERVADLLAQAGEPRLSYELRNSFQLYLADVIDANELEDWIGVSKDRLRFGRKELPKANRPSILPFADE